MCGCSRPIIGTVVGAIVAFLWGFLSWAVLHLWIDAYKPMPHAEAIMPVLKQSMPEPGVYSFPPFDMHAMESMDETQQNAAFDRWAEQANAGPFGYVAIHPNGVDAMGMGMLGRGFLIDLIAAGCMAALMSMGGCPHWRGRFLMGLLIAVPGAIMLYSSLFNYMFIPASFVGRMTADVLLTLAITSAVVAAIVKPGKHTHALAGAGPITSSGHQCQEC